MNENLKKKCNEISPNKVINKNTGVGNLVYEGISKIVEATPHSENKNKLNSLKHYSNLCKLNSSNSDRKISKLLKYVPKKNLNFPKIDSIPKLFNKPKKFFSLEINRSISLFEKGISENDHLKFKSETMFKLINIMDNYIKTKNNYSEYLSEIRKDDIINFYNSLKNKNNEFIQFLFDDLGKNCDFLLWKKLILYILERINNHYHILYIYINELCDIKNQINNLDKKNKIQKYELKNNMKEIKKLNNILKENKKSITERNTSYNYKSFNYDLSKKQIKENIQKIEIYNLNSEIKDLTNLLEKNKDFYNKCLNLENELEKKNAYIKELKNIISQNYIEMKAKMAVYNENKKDLEEKIHELTNENNKNFKEIASNQKEIFEEKTKNKQLKILKEISYERLNMLYEEMNSWIYMYIEEKKEHIKTKKTLETLENIMRIKEE